MTTPKPPNATSAYLPPESVRMLNKLVAYQKKLQPMAQVNRSSVNQGLIAVAYAQLPEAER